MELTIDKAGRVVIPKPVREALQLQAGDILELEQDGETLQLRPVREESSLRKEHGIWVYHPSRKSPRADTDAKIKRMRNARLRSLSR